MCVCGVDVSGSVHTPALPLVHLVDDQHVFFPHS